MRLTPRTVAYRVGIISAAAFASATALIGIAVLYAVHTAFLGQLDETIVQAKVSLIGEFQDDGEDGLAEAMAIREAGASSVLGFALFDAKGSELLGGSIPLCPRWAGIALSSAIPLRAPTPRAH